LIEWIGEFGRAPEPDEFADAEPVVAEFGSLRRAFALIRKVTNAAEWEEIARRRTEDLLVSMALANFGRRPRQSALPLELLREIKAFFGTYKQARERADELLFRAGDAGAVHEACTKSALGKLLPNALYVHRSALDDLVPLLRVYVGCARAYLGDIDEANIIKLHRFSGKVSYLAYPDFETDPHPALATCVKLNMRSRQIDFYDYRQSANPPVLHRKETFLPPDHPLFAKFARLTRQEERHGLLDDAATIGTRDGWQTRLATAGFRLAGHRLVKRKE
jgi:DNA phosphorothioation-associated putative methyltransferase